MQAGRGHDPHRRPRERPRRPRPRPTTAVSLAGVLEPRRRRGRARAGAARPSCCRCSRRPASSTPAAPGFLLLLDAVLHVVDGEPLPEPDDVDAAPTAVGVRGRRHAHGDVDGELDVSELRYEVMYFLDLADDAHRRFKEAWGGIGDSIVVVGGDGLWNCHVHTDDIGAAIEAALDVAAGRARSGSPTCSSRSRRSTPSARRAMTARRRRRPRCRCELPPVTTRGRRGRAPATGIAELFHELGVQGVVTGGQTMNPSTAELLDAVERVNADHVVDPAQQQEHHPGRRAGRRPHRRRPSASCRPGRCRRARRARGLRPGGRRCGQRDRDDRRRRLRDDRRGHPGGARHELRRSARSSPATGSG